jgi:putative DNA methylase
MTSDHPVKRRKKLIEVAIPLEAINQACKEEKAVPRRGHPGTMHFWWAPRPLAAARAVLLCQLIDDPSDVPEEFGNQDDISTERLRLFHLVASLSQWENTNNKKLIEAAKAQIRRSWKRYLDDNNIPDREMAMPPFLDPFSGGGAIPLEAQRLGLQVTAADLNPMSVLINKAKI